MMCLAFVLILANLISCALNTNMLLADKTSMMQLWWMRQAPITALLIFAAFIVAKFVANLSTKAIARHLALLRIFNQDAGHELASPVAIVDTHLQVLERELQEKGYSSEHIATMQESMDRINGLINDIRFLAKSQIPLRQGNLLIFKMDELVKDCARSLQPKFDAKNIEFYFESSGNCGLVADKEGFSRVVINLIENALKYSQQGNRISVSLKEQNNTVQMTVADNGKGISKCDLSRVFERFYRTDTAEEHAPGGSGFGLAIVKAVVESQGGRISVESQLGEGTAFQICIPKTPTVHPLAFFFSEETYKLG